MPRKAHTTKTLRQYLGSPPVPPSPGGMHMRPPGTPDKHPGLYPVRPERQERSKASLIAAMARA